MDRLFRKELDDPRLQIAIEFLQSVFDRSDVPYHLAEHEITKPVFVSLITIRPDRRNQSLASLLLNSCLASARNEGCNGALSLCSNKNASSFMTSKFRTEVYSVRYRDYRGEHREPPIAPPEVDAALRVLLNKL
uniref:N-acetyltransferase domain-containing protein n=1 Tax=Heterorhabditis bacteriophora TaxID=37862 RepID=A0A1I7XDS7_HETBA